jgi:hypothetical protein
VILVATNADVQFSSRESPEPLYRRLVGPFGRFVVAISICHKGKSQISWSSFRSFTSKLQNFLQQACQDSKL